MAGEKSYTRDGRLYSNSEVMILDGLAGAKAAADRERRAEMRRRVAMYRDDWKGQLEDRIKKQFEVPETQKDLLKVIDLSNNLCKFIIDEISTIYCDTPVYKFGDGVDGSQWTKLIEDGLWAAQAQELNRYTNLCNVAVVHVAPEGDHLAFRVYTADEVVVWEDPTTPGRPIAAAYRQGFTSTAEAKPRWHFWSRSEEPTHAILEGDDMREALKRPIFEEPNPYADEHGEPVIPLVFSHRRLPCGSFWDQDSGSDLTEGMLVVASLETWINHLVRTDSIRQKYSTGLLDALGDQEGGTTSILQFRNPQGGPVSVGEFSSQANWPGLRQVVNDKYRNLVQKYGLHAGDAEAQGSPASGFSMRVRKEGLIELRKRQLPLYRKFERELYAATCAVWNFERTNAESEIPSDAPELPWPSAAGFDVRFAEFQVPLTVEERAAELELARKRIAMGLESPITIYLKEHPEQSEEEAREAIAKNIADANVAPGGQQMVAPPAPAQPDLAMSLAQRIKARVQPEHAPPKEDAKEEPEKP